MSGFNSSDSNGEVASPFGATKRYLLPVIVKPPLPTETCQFLVWRYQEGGGSKPRKVPYSALTGRAIDPADSTHLVTFEEAFSAWESRPTDFDGIGYSFTRQNGIVGIDLDECRDITSGNIEPWALRIVQHFDTYTEVSPSGRGLHLFVSGKLPEGHRTRPVHCGLGIEVYSEKRYFTLTCRRLPIVAAEIRRCPDALEKLYRELFDPTGEEGPYSPPIPKLGTAARDPSIRRQSSNGITRLADSEVLARCRRAINADRFNLLWDGHWEGLYGSQSEADFALLGFLIFHLSDVMMEEEERIEQINRMFCQSGLYRPKWEERRGSTTWGRYSIKNLLGKREAFGASTRRSGSTAEQSGSGEADGSGMPPPVDPPLGDATEGNDAEDGLPVIETSNRELPEMSVQALEALVRANDPPIVFRRGGSLVRVRIDEAGHAAIQPLEMAELRHYLARSAHWISTGSRGRQLRIVTPREVVVDLLAAPDWPGLPPLQDLVTAPVLGPGGQLKTEPGYHPDSQTYYHQVRPLVLPDTAPTPERLAWAKERLLGDLLGEFPFADDASRAHALALMLLPFVRAMIQGPTPLHLVEAPAPGTGKSLLAKVVIGVFTGEPVAVIPGTGSEEEWRKRLFTFLLQGGSHLVFDNLKGYLDSAALAAVLTADRYDDRVLGSSRSCRVPVRCIWVATANNLTMHEEIARRTLLIRLDAGVEQPEARAFRVTNLESWAVERRAELMASAIIILRWWIAQGRPLWSGGLVGSLEHYTQVMGGVLSTAGVDGFLGNQSQKREQADPMSQGWEAFFHEWHRTYGERPMRAAEVFPLARQVIPEVLGDRSERGQQTALGVALRQQRGRVYGGLTVESAPTLHGCPRYVVKTQRQQTTGD